jgi:hypothetical protein
MALKFNATRDGLLLDDSQQAYAYEPEFIYTSFGSGIYNHYSQQAYAGPHHSRPSAGHRRT